MNVRLTAGVLAVFSLALAGCGSSTPTPTASATVASAPAAKPAKPKPAVPAKLVADAPAQLACGHFANVMGDFSKGILTSAEMRTKIQEVYDNASVSANKGIPELRTW